MKAKAELKGDVSSDVDLGSGKSCLSGGTEHSGRLIIGRRRRSSLGEDLPKKIRRIETKIDSIKKMLRRYIISEKIVSEYPLMKALSFHAAIEIADMKDYSINIYLLKLPDSLRKTMLAMSWLKEASAHQVAELSGRTRCVESFHLNQLERMGYLVKSKKGKKVYFKIPQLFVKKVKETLTSKRHRVMMNAKI